jgi:hypothetical protein
MGLKRTANGLPAERHSEATGSARMELLTEDWGVTPGLV